MIYENQLQGGKVTLRMVEFDDCGEQYLSWLNDSDVNQFLETRWEEQTVGKIKDFVRSVKDSTHSYLFAIVYDNNHVGNIKIGPIHPIYKYADVSYFVGEKSAWGRGVASEAIKLVTEFGFKVLNLHRMQAGVIEGNAGSERALLKNGYQKEAVFRKKFLLDDIDKQYVDAYFYGILNDEWCK